MVIPAALLAFALVSADAQLDRPPVREELASGVWFEPLLRFHGIGSGRAGVLGSDAAPLPLGLEVGHRVGPAFVSVSVADLPVDDMRQTLAAAGARVYHGAGPVATYLGAQVGAIRERIREGSPFVVNPFAMLGPVWSWRRAAGSRPPPTS